MHVDDYNNTSAILRTRHERLLKERELRKSFKSQNEDVLGNGGTDSIIGNGQILTTETAVIRQRLLVVANRLPVSATRKGEASWQLEMSVGGLVSALLGITDFDTKWIGWAGVNVPDEIGQKSLTEALAEKRCIPVFLDEDLVNLYYNGYCNNILWPLFHYLGLPQEDRLATTRSFQSQFDAYKKANQMFADVVNEHYTERDVIWCHDYHLMFLPKCLKEHNNKMKVGWFLHTPFPSSEIHRTLPSRSELLRAVLVADLVGFHTYDYARHFVSACTRILGLEGTPDGVEDQGKLTRVAAVMLGVDRLDMIKGIPQKILAFEKFLEENPDWHDKVVLLQIAVPTRTDVPEYQKLTCQVHEIVGRINGRFGSLTTVPIHHLDRSLDFHGLCALYAITDVALITSLRDGMNLVSYEFVACQASKKGVLILTQSLGAGAILVNPWNITEVASSIAYALNMPAEEREKRHHNNFMHVTTHTSQEWAETFVSELNDTIVEAQLRIRQIPPLLQAEKALERYLHSNNPVLNIIIQAHYNLTSQGFNATLTEPVDSGRRVDQFKEMEPKLHPDVKESLRKLCDDPKTTVVVLSGSHHSILDKNLGEFNIWLAAEHGVFLRTPNKKWIRNLPEIHMDWVDSVKCFISLDQPNVYIIMTLRTLDVEFGKLQAKDMLQHLWTGPISNASVEVVQGGRSVEVRAVGVTKPEPQTPVRSSLSSPVNGSSTDHSVGRNGFSGPRGKKSHPFSASDGNDACNENGNGKDTTPSILDLNSNNYFSCAVKRKRSSARYLLSSSADVVSLLEKLADVSSER
ncbi:hypothetical protein Ccrd_020974 [Cynara cardunculus var. scolymus]|uniref:alpha,alpha-trehalose-phosphate synthase (UDP-forming) n=1 Tax=Cynara cardunculus var. scolymus TaxID=59895 RepID=A0A103Y1G6_CYNCS|nr:hypothetical protein Ccrd_020974 [Cynara cardunculus var. scolymus]